MPTGQIGRSSAAGRSIRHKLKEAIESQNADLIMKATDELTQLGVEKEKARIKIAEQEAESKEATRAQLTRPELPEQEEMLWKQRIVP